MSFNKATLLGNLGADPEIRTLNSGDRVANLRLATSESWKDKSTGERKEVTEWHRVVVYNDGLCGVIEKFLSKGDTILIEGKITTRKWTDQSGVEKYSTEIVLGNFDGKLVLVKTKGSEDRRAQSGGSQGGFDQYSGRGGPGHQLDQRGNPQQSFQADLDDEIPF
jgi:single-strand DNA-binding protein